MITVEYIKELVESKVGGIDIGVYSKTGIIAYYRYVAFKLCRIYAPKKTTLSYIGKVFGNRDHSTVSVGLKRFDDFEEQKFFKPYLSLYERCVKDIEESNLDTTSARFKSINSIKTHYRLKHIALVEKSHEVIGSLTKKLHNLRHRQVFKDIAELSEEDLEDFEVRAGAFLQMIKLKNK